MELHDFLEYVKERRALEGDNTTVLLQDENSGQTLTLSMRDYLIGAVASEMPVSWPDEALKAQAV